VRLHSDFYYFIRITLKFFLVTTVTSVIVLAANEIAAWIALDLQIFWSKVVISLLIFVVIKNFYIRVHKSGVN
jgi:hypothetical protein